MLLVNYFKTFTHRKTGEMQKQTKNTKFSTVQHRSLQTKRILCT